MKHPVPKKDLHNVSGGVVPNSRREMLGPDIGGKNKHTGETVKTTSKRNIK